MKSSPIFPPFSRHYSSKTNLHIPQSQKHIQIDAPKPHSLLFCAKQLAQGIKIHCQKSWEITASRTIPKSSIAAIIRIDPNVINFPQGYHLTITEEQIIITGADDAGVFYGVQTLKQALRQSLDGTLPCLEIIDYPDFLHRGVMLDISRDKVYRMETLFMLVDEFASWKINQLQLYMEHTFAYVGHEVVWQDSSPMTPGEILALDQYCKKRYIELVPNQNSFGHMSRWLKHSKYTFLAETTEPVDTPWGNIQTNPFSLAPTLPASVNFISGLYDQLIPNFSSKMINVGCDETFDIGAGQSKIACEEKGKGQVYLDYLLSLHRDVSQRRLIMQFWGDIILQHPNLVPQLPKDLIALDWGYEGDHPFEKEAKIFCDADIPFYVCPGTSSWNSIGGRMDNMLMNCRTAAEYGLRYHAKGYLNTDWGDNGHWQQLPISFPGFAMSAAFSWCLDSNKNQDVK